LRQLALIISVSLVLAGYGFAAAEYDHAHDHAAHASGSSTLTAIVASGTSNGKSIEGDKATLSIHQNSQMIEQISAVVDKDGKAFFEKVPFAPQLLAVVNVMHDEMSFNSRVIQLKPEPSEHFAKVEVYDISDDNSVLSAGTHHIIIKTMANGIYITEYLQLRNSTDKAVFSKKIDSEGKKVIIEVKLPKGAKDPVFTDYFNKSALVFTKDGFYDTMAMPPGNHNCQFSYSIDIDSEIMNIEKQFTLATSNVTVFAQIGNAEITGLGQASGEMIMQDGTPASYYDIKNMKQGEAVSFKIVGLTPPKSEKDLWIMMSVVFGVIGVVVLKRLVFDKSENAQQIDSE